MAAANFVVIINGGGARSLEQPISTNSVPRAFFPRVAIGCRLLGRVLTGGYMRWYSGNRRYGIWINIYRSVGLTGWGIYLYYTKWKLVVCVQSWVCERV